MKLNIFATIGLLMFYLNAWGQDSINAHIQQFSIRDPPTKRIKPPLYVIKFDDKTCPISTTGRSLNRRQVRRALKKVNADLVQSIDVIKGKEATDKYGLLGTYGVIVINMKDGEYDSVPRKLKRACK